MVEHPVNAPVCERRIALKKRLRVAEMSPEEMRRELLTSEVTGLPNRRSAFALRTAFPTSYPYLFKALSPSTSGMAMAGTAFASSKREAGLEAYHDKGDEFLCRGNLIEELLGKLERARAILRDRAIHVERADGSLTVTGADFSYGVGADVNEAEFALKRHKAEREGRGEIARGELRSITIRIEKPEHSFPELSTLQRIPWSTRRPAAQATN
jgi:hypothetical protein